MKKTKRDIAGQLPLAGVAQGIEIDQAGRIPGMPTLAVLRQEVAKHGLPPSDADHIFDSWLMSDFRLKNGRRIKSWQAAVRVWFRNGWFPSQKKRRSTVIDDQQAERRQKQFQRIKDGSN